MPQNPTSPYRADIERLTQDMRALLLRAAQEQGGVRYHSHFADNYWTVTLKPDGSVLNQNYAEEARGPHSLIEDLQLFELAGLVQSLQNVQAR